MDENKRKSILLAAMKLFNERGFHGTPTSLIAKKGKVSVGTLFNYYETKEELIHAVYMEIKLHSKYTFLTLIEEKASLHDRLKSMWNAVIKWGINNPDEFEYTELFIHSSFKKSLNDEVMGSFKKFRESILLAISPKTICLKYPEYSMYYIDNALHATIKFILTSRVKDTDSFIASSFEMLWSGFSNDSTLQHELSELESSTVQT
jgi:AcrR family transcriptional regulator